MYLSHKWVPNWGGLFQYVNGEEDLIKGPYSSILPKDNRMISYSDGTVSSISPISLYAELPLKIIQIIVTRDEQLKEDRRRRGV